ncbi:VOC family protein [Ruicaihuangia caeni]|uniref:VOC family protein n=1 Tax=Ruicaihuangia caeni TaxID=3042517 RepID=A0AAW6T767_9MICO|nr:VOC family protein [Klugiella sp. YN-L-19]MDI2098941.1 VOC family protein [Klugiella sp. YN-L-19]
MAHGDITHIDIPVSDMERAKAFYSRLFGWEILEYPGFEGYPMWRAPNGVSGGGLAPRDERFTQPRSTVEVDSIDDTIAATIAAGGQVAAEKTQIDATSWWAVVVDPDGNEIGLYEGSTDTGGTDSDASAGQI